MKQTREKIITVLKVFADKQKKTKNEYIKSIYQDVFTAITAIYKACQEDEKELNEYKTIQEYNNRLREQVISKSAVISTKVATETSIKNNDTDAIRKILDTIAIDLLHIQKLENGGTENNDLKF